MKTTLIILFCSATVFIASSGCDKQQPAEVKQKPENTFSEKGSVKEINIWPETPEFPEHPGKAEFMSYCAVCHTLRYISTQPNFPRKTWEAEVKKMITKFNAPIDSVMALKIVDYLAVAKSNSK
jgi:hypothetical protein